jgi:hypothetical protein
MKRHLFLIASFLVVFIGFVDASSKPKPVDRRVLISAVDQSKHSFTVEHQLDKRQDTYVLADPVFYHLEVDIDGEVKSFADLKAGMEYVTSTEVSPGVVSVIVAKTASPAPTK